MEFLRGRFGKVPKNIERAINQMNGPIALKSLAARTLTISTGRFQSVASWFDGAGRSLATANYGTICSLLSMCLLCVKIALYRFG